MSVIKIIPWLSTPLIFLGARFTKTETCWPIISSGEKHTVKEFLLLAFKYVGLDYRNYVKVDKSLTKRNLNYLIGDPTKIKKLCGWKSKIKFVELINKLVQHEIDSLWKKKY